MDCDIHMFCEEKETINGVTEWRNVDHLKKNHYHGLYEDCEESEFEVVELCSSRDYSMFTALCGVRDCTGQSPKIDDPRGLPKDCCAFIREESDRWGCDGHSHSYVNLRQVRDFVKENKPIKFSGLVRNDDAKQFKESGKLPTFWCQGAGNRDDYEFIEWEDNTLQPLSKLYELMAKRFRGHWEPNDISDEDAENFRIVFWFDN